MRYFLLLLFLSAYSLADTKQFTVTVVSSESIQQDTGFESSQAQVTRSGVGYQGSGTSNSVSIPVRFLYVTMDGKKVRLRAKQKFMSSYGKTLPPGDYQAEWKNSHTLRIHYTENEKAKTADYEMAGLW
jgi:hypothetical protein